MGDAVIVCHYCHMAHGQHTLFCPMTSMPVPAQGLQAIRDASYAPAYVWWKDTSVEAYLSAMGSKRVTALRPAVFRVILDSMPAGTTRNELYQGPFAGIKWGTLTARVWELLQISPPILLEGPDKRGGGYVLRVARMEA